MAQRIEVALGARETIRNWLGPRGFFISRLRIAKREAGCADRLEVNDCVDV
jgi:hypothetical protein